MTFAELTSAHIDDLFSLGITAEQVKVLIADGNLIAEGAITEDKLAEAVKTKLNESGNVDLDGYSTTLQIDKKDADTLETAKYYTDDSLEIPNNDWLKYFDYYYIGDRAKTNIDGAGKPVLNGATFVDGVFTFDSAGDYVALPAEASANLHDAEVVILGMEARNTSSNTSHEPVLFKVSDGRRYVSRIVDGRRLGTELSWLSHANFFFENRDVGLSVVFRDNNRQGWVNGNKMQLSLTKAKDFADDDTLQLGENLKSGNGIFDGTMKEVMIMSTNAAYGNLSTSEKDDVVEAAARWVSTKEHDALLKEVDLDELTNRMWIYLHIQRL